MSGVPRSGGPKTIGFGTNQDSRSIDFMVFVDRHSTFYNFFTFFLWFFMVSIVLLSNFALLIESIVPVSQTIKKL